MYFHYLPIQISIVLFVFVSLCRVPGCCNWLLSIRWLTRRKLELDSSLSSCCSIVVVHCASLPIKKYYSHSQLCPFVSFAGTNPGYWVWCVGLRWDDDAGKHFIFSAQTLLVCSFSFLFISLIFSTVHALLHPPGIPPSTHNFKSSFHQKKVRHSSPTHLLYTHSHLTINNAFVLVTTGNPSSPCHPFFLPPFFCLKKCYKVPFRFVFPSFLFHFCIFFFKILYVVFFLVSSINMLVGLSIYVWLKKLMTQYAIFYYGSPMWKKNHLRHIFDCNLILNVLGKMYWLEGNLDSVVVNRRNSVLPNSYS